MTTVTIRGHCEAPTGTSPADAARELAEFGSTVLRDVWSQGDLAVLREAIAGFCDHRADMVERGRADPVMRQYHRMGTTVLTWLLYEGRIDLPFLARMFNSSFYQRLCELHFGDTVLYIAPERIGSRSLRPPYSAEALLPFHQDSVEQDPRIGQVLNAWIPLDPGAGFTAPGLELVRTPGTPGFPLRPRGSDQDKVGYANVGIDPEAIAFQFGENLLRPAFELGDCAVFGQDVIHRTHVTSEMTGPRIGFEFRVFSMSSVKSQRHRDKVLLEAFPLV